MGLSAIVVTLLALNSASWASKLPQASYLAPTQEYLTPKAVYLPPNNGYLPPINQCPSVTVTSTSIQPPITRQLPAVTSYETVSSVEYQIKTAILTITRQPVTRTATIISNRVVTSVALSTVVPRAVTSVVTSVKYLAPITLQAVTLAPVTLQPVTLAAVTSTKIQTVIPDPVTFTIVSTLPAVTLARVTIPAVTLPPSTLPARIVTVTTTVPQAPQLNYLPPVTQFHTATITRSLPPVIQTVTKCGYNYPEPSKNFIF